MSTPPAGSTLPATVPLLAVASRSELAAASAGPAVDTLVVRVHNAVGYPPQDWTFQRQAGRATALATGSSMVCPVCGAPQGLNQNGVCIYCGTNPSLSADGWVVTATQVADASAALADIVAVAAASGHRGRPIEASMRLQDKIGCAVLAIILVAVFALVFAAVVSGGHR